MLVIGKGLAGKERVLKTMGIFSAARTKIELALGEIFLNVPATGDSSRHLSGNGRAQACLKWRPCSRKLKRNSTR